MHTMYCQKCNKSQSKWTSNQTSISYSFERFQSNKRGRTIFESDESYEIIPNGSAKSPVPTFPFKMCINTPKADVPSCPFRGLLFRGASIRSSRFNFRLKFWFQITWSNLFFKNKPWLKYFSFRVRSLQKWCIITLHLIFN